MGIRVFAIVAPNRVGLQSKLMRMSDLRRSSALQDWTEVEVILSNKLDTVSRDRLAHGSLEGDDAQLGGGEHRG
jgi:hypothetical protein